MKNIYTYSGLTAAVLTLLAACGGGDSIVIDPNTGIFPNPGGTLTPTPVLGSTNTPVPVNTNTPVPVITNTPLPNGTTVPVNTNTPVPAITNTSVPLTPTNTNTPAPTATNTNTPVPTATGTATPVPTVTNTSTPVPTATGTATPVPTVTNTSTPVPTATDTATPVPTATNTSTPVPTATDTGTPVPTATNTSTPVPTATDTATPVPTATDTATPVPTATDTATPVPTATDTATPVPTATDTATPVPTATDTATPVPTATSTPAASPCVPAAPVEGQTLKVDFDGVDGQLSGEGYYPTGKATLNYIFNAGNYSVQSVNPGGLHPNIPPGNGVQNPNYVWFTSGSYSAVDGFVTADNEPVLYDQAEEDMIVNNQDFDTIMSKSFVGYEPSDWAQRLAKQLANASTGTTAQMTVTLIAQGKLPGLLSMVSGDGLVMDPQNNKLRARMNVTATRLANGTVGAYSDACKFSFTMRRPMTVPGIVEAEQAQAGGNYSASDPALQAAADAAIDFLGNDLQEITFDERMGFEVYMPVMNGTFATSNQVPFFTINTPMNHIYGVSAAANPHIIYTNLGGILGEKATDPSNGSDYQHMPAMQSWTYKP